MATREGQQVEVLDLEKVRRHQRILLDLGRLSVNRMERDAFLHEVCLLVAQALEVGKAKVMRFRAEQGDLLLEAGVGWKPGVVGSTTFSIDLASAPGRAFQTGEPVVVQDIGATDEFRASPPLVEHGVVSLANVPISIDGASWGVLEVDSSTLCDFNEDTVDFMMSAAFTVAAVLRREEAEAAQARALAQAAADQQHHAMLAVETQHRTRNYFSLVLSVLALQRPRAENAEARALFDGVVDRVQAIALAHDQLDPTRHRSMVDMPVYLRALCGSLDQQFDAIAVEVRADALELAPERAIALGLSVNELVTNSIKHAFGEGGGSVTVGLKAGLAHGKAELSVADNGRGVEASVAAGGKAGGGTGTRLLAALARRVGGEMRRESTPAGTTTRILFPMAG